MVDYSDTLFFLVEAKIMSYLFQYCGLGQFSNLDVVYKTVCTGRQVRVSMRNKKHTYKQQLQELRKLRGVGNTIWAPSQGSPAAHHGQAAPITPTSSSLQSSGKFSLSPAAPAWMTQLCPRVSTAPIPQAQGGNPL